MWDWLPHGNESYGNWNVNPLLTLGGIARIGRTHGGGRIVRPGRPTDTAVDGKGSRPDSCTTHTLGPSRRRSPDVAGPAPTGVPAGTRVRIPNGASGPYGWLGQGGTTCSPDPAMPTPTTAVPARRDQGGTLEATDDRAHVSTNPGRLGVGGLERSSAIDSERRRDSAPAGDPVFPPRPGNPLGRFSRSILRPPAASLASPISPGSLGRLAPTPSRLTWRAPRSDRSSKPRLPDPRTRLPRESAFWKLGELISGTNTKRRVCRRLAG